MIRFNRQQGLLETGGHRSECEGYGPPEGMQNTSDSMRKKRVIQTSNSISHSK
jgi:hypothetical protein